jgi:stage II sporulation protein Q
MKEENNTPKNKWSQIFRRKWFFPAVYLTIAALLLSAVVWYQNTGDTPDAQDADTGDEYNPTEFDEDAKAVLDQQEVIKMPVKDEKQAEIVTKFYDYNAEQDEQEAGLVLYNNRYYQSTGIDIAGADDEAFDVVASLSGTVTEVKEDPLLGNVVVVSHENDVMTYYASLAEVEVEADTTVKQGEAIGTAGKNIFGKDNGTHVHFEIRKDGQEVNPETFFNQPLSKLDDVVTEEEEKAAEQEKASEDNKDTEAEAEEDVDAKTEEHENGQAEEIEPESEQDKDAEQDETEDKKQEESDTEADEDEALKEDASA